MSKSNKNEKKASATPGDWLPSFEQPDEPERCAVWARLGGREYLVATIENGAPGDTLETEKANARLIAASPRMLAACQLALKLLDGVAAEEERNGKRNAAMNVRETERALREAVESAIGGAA